MTTYTQTIYDDFNDNSFDTTLWNRTNSTSVVEASAVMTLSETSSNVELISKNTFDLTNGIVAAKISKNNTAAAATEAYINITDAATLAAGNQAQATSTGTAGTISWDNRGSCTITSPTNVGTPVGPTASSGWTAGTWWGIGNMGATNVLHLYKSSDGQTWTEMSHVTLGGTFSKTAAHVEFMTNNGGTTTTFQMVVDDVSYFLPTTIVGKVRSAGAWVTPTAVKVRSGGAWVDPTAVKVRSGGAWVVPS